MAEGVSGSKKSLNGGSRANSRSASPHTGQDEQDGGNTDEVWKCNKCEKSFKDKNSQILECPRCAERYCSKCLDMKASEYKLVNVRSDFHWFCPPCEKKIFQNIKIDHEVEERCKVFMESMEKRVDSLEYKLEKEIKRLDEKIDAKTEARLVESQEEGLPGAVSKEDLVQAVRKEIKLSDIEHEDREARKKNIVVFNVPEPKVNSIEEQYRMDKQEMIRVFNEILDATINEDSLLRVVRLGKTSDKERNDRRTNDNRDEEKLPRPVVIVVKEDGVKRKIFMKLKKLGESSGPEKEYKFAHDQTEQQRQEFKKMLEKAKKLQDEDREKNHVYLIRGPPWNRKIKKIPKREER